jgi:hypothetical protein
MAVLELKELRSMLESMFTAAGAVPGWAVLFENMQMITNDSSAEVGGFRS